METKALWLFDVDGVITNPVEKRITLPGIIDSIIRITRKNDIVAFNSGRSLVWMNERLLQPLISSFSNPELLQNCIAVGEKGAGWIQFDASGGMEECIDETVSIPERVHAEVKRIVDERYADIMFFDDTKQTMISVEMKDGIALDRYRDYQTQAVSEFRILLHDLALEGSIDIDPTRIAIDIENKHVGKALGAKRVLDWTETNKIRIGKCTAFGDTVSDLDMADPFVDASVPFDFIYVGEPGDTAGMVLPFHIVYTGVRYDAGTLEYLRDHDYPSGE